MLCALCIWQIPTEINSACNFHWHNGCDCTTLLKVYCFFGGWEEGKGHAFISLVEFVNLVKYWISLLAAKYLSAKAESGFVARKRWEEAFSRAETHHGACRLLQRPLLSGASAFRDTESQIVCKVWADLTCYLNVNWKGSLRTLRGEVSQFERKFLLQVFLHVRLY